MKKFAIFIAAVFMSLSLTSCFESHQLNETAIVQAIAVDLAENGQYEVTMQIYAPKGGGSTTAIDTSNNNSNIVSAKGKTISEAMIHATALQGEYIFAGHNRLLILGEEFAKQGVENVFSYFDRNHLTRQNIDVLVSKGKAKDIVALNIDQGILAAETLEKTVENCETNGYITRAPYYQFSRDMFLYYGCAAVPVIEKIEKPEQSQPEQKGGEQSQGKDGEESGRQEDAATDTPIDSVDVVKVEKTAVFKDYKLIDTLDQEQSRGVTFLSDSIKNTTLVAQDSEGHYASVHIYECDSKLSPKFDGDQITFVLKVRAKASIDEVLLPRGETTGAEDLEEFADSAEQSIAADCTGAFNRAVKTDGSHLFSLGDMIHKKNPELWKQISEDFSDHLSELSFKTDVEIEITRLSIEANQSVTKLK